MTGSGEVKKQTRKKKWLVGGGPKIGRSSESKRKGKKGALIGLIKGHFRAQCGGYYYNA